MCNGIRLKKKGKKVFLFIQKIEKANLPQKVLLGFLGSILRWRHEDGVYDPELWSQRLARRTRTELLAWGASGSAKTRTHIAPQRKATRKKKLYETKYINYYKKVSNHKQKIGEAMPSLKYLKWIVWKNMLCNDCI